MPFQIERPKRARVGIMIAFVDGRRGRDGGVEVSGELGGRES